MPSKAKRQLQRAIAKGIQRSAANVPDGQSAGMAAMTVSSFQGPLPPPEMLAEYERLVPNGAERIFTVFEKQVDHRIDLESRVIGGNERRATLGLGSGTLIGVVGLGVAGFVAYHGQQFAAVGITAIDLVSLVSVFVVGSGSRRAERVQKARVLGGR